MACCSTSSEVADSIGNLVECSICTEVYKDPRQLPCLHTFCLLCIQRLCRHRQPGNRESCPICRRDFLIPRNGVNGLPKNFWIEELKDKLKRINGPCEMCSETGDAFAVQFCENCRKKLCDSCVGKHRNGTDTLKHTLVKVTSATGQGETSNRPSPVQCDKHPARHLDLYCLDCAVAICSICLRAHGGHTCLDVEEVADEFHHHMQNDIGNLKMTVDYCNQLLRDLNVEQNKLMVMMNAQRDKILNQEWQIKAMIERRKEGLLRLLNCERDHRKAETDKDAAKIEQHISSIKAFITHIKELKMKTPACDVAKEMNTLRGRVQSLLDVTGLVQAKQHFANSDVMFIGVKPEMSVVDDLFGTIVIQQPTGDPVPSTSAGDPGISGSKKLLGKKRHFDDTCSPGEVKFARTESSLSSSHSNSQQPSTSSGQSPAAEAHTSAASSSQVNIHRIIQGDKPVTGLTLLDNRLYVARDCQIETFDIFSFESTGLLQIRGLSEESTINDLASCSINRCVYVSEWNSAIHKVEPSKTDRSSKWEVDGSPWGLSVNADAHILVTSFCPCKILEYTADGVLVRQISMDTMIANPWHAVQLKRGSLIVSHGYSSTSSCIGPSHGVSIVDSCGRIKLGQIWKGDPHGPTIPLVVDEEGRDHSPPSLYNLLGTSSSQGASGPGGRLNQPRHLAVDRNSGRVFVADRNNNRIVMLDSVPTLRWSRDLPLPRDLLMEPCTMYWDEISKRLYVGESAGHRVIVIEVDISDNH